MNSSDLENCGDMEKLKMAIGSIKQQKNVDSEDNSIDTKFPSYFQFKMVEENYVCSIYTL